MALADTPLTENNPRLQSLTEFLDGHYVRSDYDGHKVDGDAIFRNHAVWAHERELEIPTRQAFYNDLRALGFVVRPHTSNRTTVFGIVEKPTARHAVATLEAQWPEVAMTVQERKAETKLAKQARQAVEDALVIRREFTEEALAEVLSIMRESIDEGRRLQAAAMILDRTIPKLRARVEDDETEEEEQEVIEVPEVIRTSVAEAEALHARILAERLAALPTPS